MKPYLNEGDDSGITHYDYGPDWIRVRFTRGGTYEYTSAGVGHSNVIRMKRLAKAGDGLTTFINTHPEVRDGYSRRIA